MKVRGNRLQVPLLLIFTLPWLVPSVYGPSPGCVGILLAWSCLALGVVAMAGCSKGNFNPAHSFPVGSAWILAATISSIFAICQYLGFASELSPWISGASVGEAYANLRQRNQFATLTNIGLAAVIWRHARSSGDFTQRQFAWVPSAIALMAIANAASGSRTGLAQLILLCTFAYVWGRRSTSARGEVGLALLCYAFAAFVLPWVAGLPTGTGGILARIQEEAPACASRLTLWSNVLQLVSQKPWFGWGWGELDYAHFVTLYQGQRFCDILDNAHNLPLHLAVELGVPFALLIVILSLLWIFRAKPWTEAQPARRLAWTVLGLIALHSMLEYPLWYGPFQLAVALCFLLLWIAPRSAVAPRQQSQSLSQNAARALVGSSAIILIGCIYVGWQYWRVSQIYMPSEQRAMAYKVDTLQKIRDNTLFRDQVHFAELTTTPLTADNAAVMFDLAKEQLHFSPEPKVAQLVIESALLLKRDTEAAYYLERFRAAFPKQYAAWQP